jgi:hypothetical protein
MTLDWVTGTYNLVIPEHEKVVKTRQNQMIAIPAKAGIQ